MSKSPDNVVEEVKTAKRIVPREVLQLCYGCRQKFAFTEALKN